MAPRQAVAGRWDGGTIGTVERWDGGTVGRRNGSELVLSRMYDPCVRNPPTVVDESLCALFADALAVPLKGQHGASLLRLHVVHGSGEGTMSVDALVH